MLVSNQFNRIGGSFFLSSPPFMGNLGNHSKGGQSNHLLHIFRSLDGVIQVFKEEGQPHAEEEPDDGGEKKIQSFIGFVGTRWYFRLIHYLDITDRETRRDPCFFHPLEEA